MTYFYEFELILAGIILFSAMTAGGISIWIKRKREQEKTQNAENEYTEETSNFSNA